jgi:hypothetical protein
MTTDAAVSVLPVLVLLFSLSTKLLSDCNSEDDEEYPERCYRSSHFVFVDFRQAQCKPNMGSVDALISEPFCWVRVDD